MLDDRAPSSRNWNRRPENSLSMLASRMAMVKAAASIVMSRVDALPVAFASSSNAAAVCAPHHRQGGQSSPEVVQLHAVDHHDLLPAPAASETSLHGAAQENSSDSCCACVQQPVALLRSAQLPSGEGIMCRRCGKRPQWLAAITLCDVIGAGRMKAAVFARWMRPQCNWDQQERARRACFSCSGDSG